LTISWLKLIVKTKSNHGFTRRLHWNVPLKKRYSNWFIESNKKSLLY
jgi:phage anti-repressor protein